MNGRTFVPWLVLLITAPASAQTVRVQAIESETQRPVVGAIVVLVDSAGRPGTRGLTNEGGRVVLTAPHPGTFRLRADRIGHSGILTDPFPVGDSAISITVIMPASRTVLPEVTVAGATPCDRRASGASTAELWNEIRKSLTASEITTESESVVLAVTRFRRYRTRAGVIRADSIVGRFTTRNAPFVSGDPGQLHRDGFIQERGGGFQFFAPDARLVLSDEFLEAHCFRVATADPEQPGFVGLAFEPVPGRRLPDVRGTLWVDRRSAALRHLDFEYLNAPEAIQWDGIGGRIEFQRLANGLSVATEWFIRTADRVRVEPRGFRRLRQGVDSVAGYVDEGGSAQPLGSGESLVDDQAARTAESTVASGELLLRVVSAAGKPVERATVTVPGIDSTFATDPAGLLRLGELPEGPVVLRVVAIGYAPRGLGFQISLDRRFLDTTLVLKPVAQTLAPLEVTGRTTPVVAKLEEFERRRQAGFGTFVTRAVLAKWEAHPLSVALRTVQGVRLVPRTTDCGGGFGAASLRSGRYAPCLMGPGCPMAIYVDGARMYDGDGPVPNLDDFLTDRVEAVEIYRGPSETPAELNTTGALCGAVMIWTRISGS